ncbi:DsbA family protein [Chitinibacter tainanensis]|uniref:DsbA family protein n=1 Tax=Chitinibacter tainanensis TaxID=230667 RepID=UPI0023572E2E|nr:DsbA family protein [Chitinibacter tainanensis]
MVSPQLTLHYVFDPLCGWCYAAAPLIEAAAALPTVQLVLHPGGMMAGANRQSVSLALRDYVIPHDRRIAELTGQPFGAAYFDGLLCDSSAVFDSTPPTLAILAAEQLAGLGRAMLARLQSAHYAAGERIAEGTVLLQHATALGLDSVAFSAAMTELAGDVEAHYRATQQLMQQHGLRGFPSLLLEREGRFQVLDIGPFLGQPAAFAQALSALAMLTPAAVAPSAAFCTPETC